MGEKEKQTPFDKAVDFILEMLWSLKNDHQSITELDIDWDFFKDKNRLTEKSIKKAFIKSADIPDGWDVVKEIYENLKKEHEDVKKCWAEKGKTKELYQFWSGRDSEIYSNILAVENICRKAGKDVEQW